jgi:hypothetical protein
VSGFRSASRGARAASACALALACILHASWGRADERSDLDRVRAAYQASDYADAEAKLKAMLDPVTGTLKDPALVKQARMYYAAVLIAEKRNSEASEQFKIILRADPGFEPDPLGFPSEVRDAFFDTAGKLKEELNAKQIEIARQEYEKRMREEEARKKQIEYLQKLEALAREEHIGIKNSRLVAALPFGIGQFQNGQRALGWTFLSVEAALIVANVVTVPIWAANRQSAYDAYAQRDITGSSSYLDRANTAQILNEVFFGSLLGTALLGILHAQLTFVPETIETRPRALPTVSSLRPSFAPSDGHGATFGLTGAF